MFLRFEGSVLAGVIFLATQVSGVVVARGALPGTNAWQQVPQPLTLSNCLNLALAQNSTILKSQSDVEAAYGISLQTRALVIPKIRVGSDYQFYDRGTIDQIPIPPQFGGVWQLQYPDQRWSANVQLVQSVYEGGRMTSAVRTARLTKEQALWSHQAVVADTVLEVRVAFDDVLLAQQQIVVQEASVKLLQSELDDTKRRFEAGTVPRFNVLRAEVEVANARPRLIRAQNGYRIAKQNLVNLLGFHLPEEIGGNVPVELAGDLEAEAMPVTVELADAIVEARRHRPELSVLRKAVSLRQEGIITARAGYKPSVQFAGGYEGRSSTFSRDLSDELAGWFVGGQLSWYVFDGLLTKGKVDEAKARRQQADVALDEAGRRIELEVRTAYSHFVEARELLESQKKVQEQAEEALRLARVRSEAGSGTQLDVLNAQTSLTESRTTQIQALRDYAVARARLERAMGQPTVQPSK